MRRRRFIQCDVFTSVPTKGNGLAVVVDGDGLLSDEMQELAIWTNLAETAFLLPPSHPMADYKLRIFSASGEMLFAGHPTLGSCAAWLHCGFKPKSPGVVRQECRVGLVDIDLTGEVPQFAAPETNVGPLEPERLHAILDALELTIDQVVRSAHLSNGSNWQIIELPSANDVLQVQPFKERHPEFRGV